VQCVGGAAIAIKGGVSCWRTSTYVLWQFGRRRSPLAPFGSPLVVVDDRRISAITLALMALAFASFCDLGATVQRLASLRCAGRLTRAIALLSGALTRLTSRRPPRLGPGGGFLGGFDDLTRVPAFATLLMLAFCTPRKLRRALLQLWHYGRHHWPRPYCARMKSISNTHTMPTSVAIEWQVVATSRACSDPAASPRTPLLTLWSRF